VKRLLGVALGIVTSIGGFLEIGSITTAAQAGADYRYQLIWVVLLGTICIALLIEMSGRFAAVSKHTIADAVRERFGLHFFLVPLRQLEGCELPAATAQAIVKKEAFKRAGKKNRRRFAGFSSWEAVAPIRTRFDAKAWERSSLQWMTYLDLNLRLPELLLMRVDKMSMGVSLEARVPFLDHKFVELAMSIPEKVKTRNGNLKYILKRAVRGLIPDELIDRKKQGFGVPVYEWFLDRLGQLAREELNSFCDRTDILDRESVMQVLDRRDGPRAWYLLNLALWWKQYIASEKSVATTLAG